VSADDSGTQRHLLDDSVLDDAVCTSSDGSLPGSGNIPASCYVVFISCLFTALIISKYNILTFSLHITICNTVLTCLYCMCCTTKIYNPSLYQSSDVL